MKPFTTVWDAEFITLELLLVMLHFTALMRQQLEELNAELTAKLIAAWVFMDVPLVTDGQYWDPLLWTLLAL